MAVKRAATSQQAREIAAKVERDLDAAAGVAVRVAKFGLRLAVTPKAELARKFIKSILDDEGG